MNSLLRRPAARCLSSTARTTQQLVNSAKSQAHDSPEFSEPVAFSELQPADKRYKFKKPLNSFSLFTKEHFKTCQEENPQLNSNEIFKVLSDKWKNLDEAEKSIYALEAASRMQTYKNYVNVHGEPGNPRSRFTSASKFFQDRFQSIREQNPKLNNNEIFTLLSKQWKELPENEKKTYKLDSVGATESV